MKRSAEDPGSQPKKSKQLKLDTMITVSPVTARGPRPEEKEEKKGSVISISSDSQESVTAISISSDSQEFVSASSGSSQGSQNSQTEPEKGYKLSRALTSTPKTPNTGRLVRTSSVNQRLVRTSSQTSTTSRRRLSQLFSLSSGELSFSQDPDSQDSFHSETGGDPTNTHFDITKISENPLKQKQYLVHHLVAQTRLHYLGLELGPGGLPPSLPPPPGQKGAEPLSSVNCLDIWTCLDTEEEKQELGREIDEGWLDACSLLTKFIKGNTFLPAAALHKVLNEGIINHEEALIRGKAFAALCNCLQTHPPGKKHLVTPPSNNVSLVTQVQTTGDCPRSTWR